MQSHRIGSALIMLVIGVIACPLRNTRCVAAVSGGFSSAIVESFEGIAPLGDGTYPNMPIATPFVFPSGVIMDLPNPSISGTFGPYVVEFLGGGGFFGMGSEQTAMIPSGTAYLAQANPGLFTGPIRLKLPATAERVGAYFATATGSSTGAVTFEAYNTVNQLLASQTISNVHFADWKSTFVSLEGGDDRIAYVMLRGDRSSVLRVDDLMFVVPEPGPLAVVATLSMLMLRRRA